MPDNEDKNRAKELFQKAKAHVEKNKTAYMLGALGTIVTAASAYFLSEKGERYPYGTDFGREMTDEDRKWDEAMDSMIGLNADQVIAALSTLPKWVNTEDVLDDLDASELIMLRIG